MPALHFSGPAAAKIVNATQPVANASSLTRGSYVFRLTVWDDASNSTALANVTVVQGTWWHGVRGADLATVTSSFVGGRGVGWGRGMM